VEFGGFAIAALDNVKAVRGIASQSAFLLPGVLASAVARADTPVQPGKDTQINLQIPPLPRNADVDSCKAVLAVGDAGDPPATDHSGVKISKKGGDSSQDPSGTYSIEMDQPTRPKNVRVLLGGVVVWTNGGVLTADSYELPDLKDALNKFLDQQQGTAPLTQLPFTVQSDSIGMVGLRAEVKAVQVKTQSWPNVLDKTTRTDRNLPLTFGAIVRLPLDPLLDPPARTVQVESLALDADGKFDADRLLGEVEMHDGQRFATVSADYSVAQAFTLPGAAANTAAGGRSLQSPVHCTGLACYVEVDGNAELYGEIQSDDNGFPGSGDPLAKGTLKIAPAKADDQPTPWAFLKFGATANLATDTPYWFVLKASQGNMRLGLADSSGDGSGPLARDRVCVSRSGQIWKEMFRVDSILKVAVMIGAVYTPGKDDQTAAVRIVVSGAPAPADTISAAVDPAQKPATVRLAVGNANWWQAVLEVRSYAKGALHLSNVMQRFIVPA
jgi:hypothetical protein